MNIQIIMLSFAYNLHKNMKKALLLVLLCLSFSMRSNASHMMGGQITVSHISGMDYNVVYTAYRDMSGIPIAPTATLNFTDLTSGATFTDTISYDTTVVVLVPGVEEYTYHAVVTFPNTGNWRVSYEECCRNAAILNMTNPGSESHYFYSDVLVDSTNSTPIFLNPPIVLAQDSVPFYYNPLPFDADGDSISWSLDIPLSMSGLQVVGYVLPTSDSLVPFNMDPITGEITFLPIAIGNYQVSMRVKEYRNGVQIGEITRDMQILVVPSANAPVAVITNSNTAPYNGKAYTLAPGADFTMNISVFDMDAQSITIESAGEAFMLASNPATVTITNGVGSASAAVNWTPNASQLRAAAYIIGLRVSENYGNQVFQSDLSVSLRVGDATGIAHHAQAASFGINPNPSTGDFSIQYNSKSTMPVSVTVLTVDGKKAASFVNEQVIEGMNVVQVNNLHLTKGVYLVQLEQNNTKIGVQRLVIN
jgi:Secretion system C-terminal sorting domain